MQINRSRGERTLGERVQGRNIAKQGGQLKKFPKEMPAALEFRENAASFGSAKLINSNKRVLASVDHTLCLLTTIRKGYPRTIARRLSRYSMRALPAVAYATTRTRIRPCLLTIPLTRAIRGIYPLDGTINCLLFTKIKDGLRSTRNPRRSKLARTAAVVIA